MVTLDENDKPRVILHRSIAGEFEQVAKIPVSGDGTYNFSIQINESRRIHRQRWGQDHCAMDVSFLSVRYRELHWFRRH